MCLIKTSAVGLLIYFTYKQSTFLIIIFHAIICCTTFRKKNRLKLFAAPGAVDEHTKCQRSDGTDVFYQPVQMANQRARNKTLALTTPPQAAKSYRASPVGPLTAVNQPERSPSSNRAMF